MKITTPVPFDVEYELSEIGKAISIARKRRNLKQIDLASRAGCSRSVIMAIEKGKTVSVVHLLSVLWVMGLAGRVAQALKPEADLLGVSLERNSLKQRVRDKFEQGDDREFF